MMNIKEKLDKYGKKIIALEDLRGILNITMSDSQEMYEAIGDLVNKGYLEPVKNSGITGNKKYPLNKKYRILIENESYENELKQIGKLHPLLQKSGYLLNHPKDYLTFKVEIEKLNAYFFSSCSKEPVSRKERSFEIFGRERVLDDSSFKSFLKNMQITETDLNFYDTPEYCFHDYIPSRKEKMTLLICENKDIWFNIRRCMFENHWNTLFGIEIDGVVYGNGNKVSQKQGALFEYIKFMGNPEVSFLYWGDIDREGMDIFRRTKEVNKDLNISLFIPGYRKMIEKARNTDIEDSLSSKKEGMCFEDLFMDFTPDEVTFLNTVLAENKLIPQEIIPFTSLSER